MKQSHQCVFDLVCALEPLDALEKTACAFTLEWVKNSPEIFRMEKPATPPIHLVSYFVLFDSETNQLLLTDHKKAGLWLPPGGHVEIDEHPKETVKREIQEELGIQADFLKELPFFLTVTKTVGAFSHTDVSLWYLLKGKSHQTFQYDTSEFHQIRWFKIEEVPLTLSDPHMERFLHKLTQLIGK